tara:strand:+ start:5533 stop:6183 length:651 start_codon:yes stop_codon:yes gene_type:complete
MTSLSKRIETPVGKMGKYLMGNYPITKNKVPPEYEHELNFVIKVLNLTKTDEGLRYNNGKTFNILKNVPRTKNDIIKLKSKFKNKNYIRRSDQNNIEYIFELMIYEYYLRRLNLQKRNVNTKNLITNNNLKENVKKGNVNLAFNAFKRVRRAHYNVLTNVEGKKFANSELNRIKYIKLMENVYRNKNTQTPKTQHGELRLGNIPATKTLGNFFMPK